MMCLWKSFLRPVNLPRVNQSELSHKGLNLYLDVYMKVMKLL